MLAVDLCDLLRIPIAKALIVCKSVTAITLVSEDEGHTKALDDHVHRDGEIDTFHRDVERVCDLWDRREIHVRCKRAADNNKNSDKYVESKDLFLC